MSCRPRSTATPSPRPRVAARGRCWRGSRCTRASTRAARSRRASGPTSSTRARAPRCAARCGSCGARSATTSALVAGRDRDRAALRDRPGRVRRATSPPGRLEEAVALHRGPLLADLDDDWVLEARDEHAERLGSALARLAAAAATPADAVGWARRRLALDPLDEDAARDLMRRLVEAGDRPGALAAYDRLSDRLRGALGLAPSAQTRALAARPRGRCRRRRRGRRGRRAAVGRRDRRWSGRDHDLAALTALWEAVRAGRGGGRGDRRRGRDRQDAAGARAASRRARAGSARTARCTAADLGGAPPFAPWVELLAGLARELEPPPAGRPLAGGARAARAVAAAAARPPAGRARRGAARPRPRAAVRGGGRARRARHGRPAAGAAVRRRPPRRRADARAGRLPRAAHRAPAACCSCSRAA